MDKLNQYRSLLKQAVCSSPYYVHGTANPDVETLFLCDEADDLYILADVGWRGEQRVRNTVLFIRIKNGKFWIEEDWTEEGITANLLRAGVSNEDIVLGFHPPSVRALTEFAVT